MTKQIPKFVVVEAPSILGLKPTVIKYKRRRVFEPKHRRNRQS